MELNNIFDSNFFDDASSCWRENKISKQNGTFLYRCCAITKKNTRCKLPILNNKKYILLDNKYCKVHMKNIKIK